MDDCWVILTKRYGDDIRNPTTEQIAEAMSELFRETTPGMTSTDHAEHGSAFLRHSHDDGPMFVLNVNLLHEVIFEAWADQDFQDELALRDKCVTNAWRFQITSL